MVMMTRGDLNRRVTTPTPTPIARAKAKARAKARAKEVLATATETTITTSTTMHPQVQVFVCKDRKEEAANKGMSSGSFYLPSASLASCMRVKVALLVLLSSLLSLLDPRIASAPSWVEAIKLQPVGGDKFHWSGEQFVITCQNNNNIKNVKIRWLGSNGQDITEDRSQRVHAESSGPHGHRLVVMNATAGVDDGEYKCTLGSTDDRYPREHTEFNLHLYRTTSFKDSPRHLVLPAGQPGTLTCKVEFDPGVLSASVNWFRDQKPIEMYNDSSYQMLDYDPARQISQLIVNPVTKQHDGIYTCRAVAVTAQLSKISDHDIRVETNYAPTFDRDSQSVWVERLSGSHHSSLTQQNKQQWQQHRSSQVNRNRHSKAHQPINQLQQRANQEMNPSEEGSAVQQQVVRVELRCSCQANPPASILWYSTASSQFVLAKGEPAHVLEEPQVEIDGHNATSTLVLAYNLEPDWPNKADSYICSASNKLGKASKIFKVEQGDPPPAFFVGPNKQYNPQTSELKFTLIGPNFDPASTSSASSQRVESNSRSQDIVPQVDAIRIRAESSTGSSAATSDQSPKSAHWPVQNRARTPEPVGVLVSLGTGGRQGQFIQVAPHNYTVSLSSLPAGNQRLFLEAHNAVGWSPNSTFLGEFDIVSGAQGPQLVSGLFIVSSVLLSLWVSSFSPRYFS